MQSKSQRVRDADDRAHELCVFLGGDDVALKVSRLLRRFGYVKTIDELRDEYRRGPQPGYYLLDVQGIGTKAIERIKEKIEGPTPPVMDVPTASLIIRMELALTDEGIGPRDLWQVTSAITAEPVDTKHEDRAVLKQAVRVAGHLFTVSTLQDAGLM